MLAKLLRPLTERLFASLNARGPEPLAQAQAAGPIVYVLRSVSIVDALAVTHLNSAWGLHSLGYVHDVSPFVRNTIAAAYRTASYPSLVSTLEADANAIIFMRRPPSLFEPTPRGASDGDDPLSVIFDFHRRSGRDVTLVPLTLLWSMRPEKLFLSPADVLFGSTDMPGDARSLLQLLTNLGHGAARVCAPLSLRQFLASQAPQTSDYTLFRRLSYSVLRKIERERRAAVGPARKPIERLTAEVLRSPKLSGLIDDLAKGDVENKRALLGKAAGILKELVATPNTDLVTAVEPLLDRIVQRVWSRVDVSELELNRVRDRARLGTVVLLPSHKSHVDYLILSYVLRKNLLELPMIAAGDNLSFFPVGPMLRRGGAFFIRRDFKGDRLYAATVDAYIRRLIKDGWSLEFFLEGGRSRTGKLLSSKLGLLNIVVDAALQETLHPIAFVPVHIGYDRTMEDFELALEKAGAPKERESARSLLAVADALSYSYGAVTVSFGPPIDLEAHLQSLGLVRSQELTPAKRRSVVTALAHKVEASIQQHAKLTAGTLLATELLDMQLRGVNLAGLLMRTNRLLKVLIRSGATPAEGLLLESGQLNPAAVSETLGIFVRGKLVREHRHDQTLTRTLSSSGGVLRDPVYTVSDESRSRLELAKNAILHFLWDRAVLSAAFHAKESRSVARSALLEEAEQLDALLGLDLPMHRLEPTKERLGAALEDMLLFGELQEHEAGLRVGPGNGDADAMVWLISHRAHLIATIESARIALQAALQLSASSPIEERALVSRALGIGREMFLRAEIDKREAVSAPGLQAAFTSFVKRGLLRRNQGHIAWTEPASEGALIEMDRRLLAYQFGGDARGGRT